MFAGLRDEQRSRLGLTRVNGDDDTTAVDSDHETR
jgi:hypothetical protein